LLSGFQDLFDNCLLISINSNRLIFVYLFSMFFLIIDFWSVSRFVREDVWNELKNMKKMEMFQRQWNILSKRKRSLNLVQQLDLLFVCLKVLGTVELIDWDVWFWKCLETEDQSDTKKSLANALEKRISELKTKMEGVLSSSSTPHNQQTLPKTESKSIVGWYFRKYMSLHKNPLVFSYLSPKKKPPF
jgi:hypothetical protein